MKKNLKDNIKFVLGIIVGILLSGTTVYAAILYASSDVSYDNSNSGINSTNVQEAVDELYANTRRKENLEQNAIYRYSTARWDSNVNISTLVAGTDYVSNPSSLMKMGTDAEKVFFKYYVENNAITDRFMCFAITEAVASDNPGVKIGTYCMKYDLSAVGFQNNVDVLTEAFGTNNGYCTISSSEITCTGVGINTIYAQRTGYLDARMGGNTCVVYYDGSTYCM